MTAQESSKAYIDEICDMSEQPVDLGAERSEIVEFFTGRTVLVTGGSGFMGKLLVDKLLRRCPDIEKLYMFMRAKKGKTPEERFKEHFEDAVYDRLRKEQPYYYKKVIMVEADTGEPDLGLTPENRERLRDTEIIFHGAATVRFDEKLRVATNINVRGTKEMLLFAREMPNIKAFVHISTAFSHCVFKFIDEKFYKSPMATDKLLTLLDVFDDQKLEAITPTIIGAWPNTYAFTKATAEDTVRQYSTGIPTCIVRPSIVISTLKEPIAGWINNLYGATGVVVGAGIGLLRTLHCRAENVADIIPADYVISNIVAAAWDIAQDRPMPRNITYTKEPPEPELEGAENIPIYNTVSSCQNPITWGKFMKLNEIYGIDVPSVMVLWHYMFRLNRYLFVHNLCVFFLHLVPAAIIDTLAVMTGRKPMLWNAYKKIHKFSGVISYFSTQQWRFRNDQVLALWDKLGPTDREIFNFNLGTLDWHEFFYYHIRGLRLYLVKDPLDTIPAGRKKYKRLRYTHYGLLTVFWLLVLWGFSSILVYLWTVITSWV